LTRPAIHNNSCISYDGNKTNIMGIEQIAIDCQ